MAEEEMLLHGKRGRLLFGKSGALLFWDKLEYIAPGVISVSFYNTNTRGTEIDFLFRTARNPDGYKITVSSLGSQDPHYYPLSEYIELSDKVAVDDHTNVEIRVREEYGSSSFWYYTFYIYVHGPVGGNNAGTLEIHCGHDTAIWASVPITSSVYQKNHTEQTLTVNYEKDKGVTPTFSTPGVAVSWNNNGELTGFTTI